MKIPTFSFSPFDVAIGQYKLRLSLSLTRKEEDTNRLSAVSRPLPSTPRERRRRVGFYTAAILTLLFAGAAQAGNELLPIDLSDAPASPWYWRSWEPPSKTDMAMLVVAEGLILVDILQTRNVLSRRSEGFYEMNPLLGSHPSDARFYGTAIAGMLITAASQFLPDPWRKVVTGGVIAYEIPNTVRSAMLGARITF